MHSNMGPLKLKAIALRIDALKGMSVKAIHNSKSKIIIK